MSEKIKAEKIIKTFRTIVIKANDEEGVIDMLIPMSTVSVDRHNESIDPKGWKKSLKEFKKRSIMLSSHNYWSLQNQIGEFLDIQITEEGLLARPKYYINQGNPEADWGYFLASKGMAAFSVGFIPIKWEDSDGKDGKPKRTFTEQELLEISHVTVPSNRDTIQSYKQLSEYEREDPIVKEVIEDILKDKDAANFYDSRLIVPYGRDQKELLEAADDEEIGTIIKDNLEGIEPDPIDPEKLKAGIEKDEKLEKMIEELKHYPEIKYIVTEDIDGLSQAEKDFQMIADRYCGKYLEYRNKFNELEKKLADIELKAGAVLNAKNKSNLKQAIGLIQLVLDSAEPEGEEGLEEGEGKAKEIKDDTVFTITDTKEVDPGKEAAAEEKTITIDPKILDQAIANVLNYHLGITEK